MLVEFCIKVGNRYSCRVFLRVARVCLSEFLLSFQSVLELSFVRFD